MATDDVSCEQYRPVTCMLYTIMCISGLVTIYRYVQALWCLLSNSEPEVLFWTNEWLVLNLLRTEASVVSRSFANSVGISIIDT